jgi:hypothetical protein
MEDWSTVDYSGVGAEDGEMRNHVLNTSSVVINLTTRSGRATLKHLSSKHKKDGSSKDEGSDEG